MTTSSQANGATANLQGTVCVVKGANSGIGKATALGLAKRGATVVLVCRDRSRGEAARAGIIAATGNPDVSVLLADLSSQESIRAMVAGFTTRHSRVALANQGLVSHKVFYSCSGHNRVSDPLFEVSHQFELRNRGKQADVAGARRELVIALLVKVSMRPCASNQVLQSCLLARSHDCRLAATPSPAIPGGFLSSSV